jgi:hypothetical protein
MVRRLSACLSTLVLAAALTPARAQTNVPAADSDPFPKLSDGELVKILATSDDKAQTAAVAQALGDRGIAGKVKLSAEESRSLHEVVTACIRKGRQSADMADAERQIQRLWRLAVPALMNGLDRLDTYSFSTKCLSVMMNEAIVKALIDKAKNTANESNKGLLRFALQSMKNRRPPTVQGRTALTAEESDKLYNDLIAPALEELR